MLILDNNVARPDGGFGTRYPWFALIGVNPFPSPIDTTAAAVVDVGYEYDYNSNAPADVLNVVAAVNSLVAYLYRHLNQNALDLPVDVDGSPPSPAQPTHAASPTRMRCSRARTRGAPTCPPGTGSPCM